MYGSALDYVPYTELIFTFDAQSHTRTQHVCIGKYYTFNQGQRHSSWT
jgi:hypothetical protein